MPTYLYPCAQTHELPAEPLRAAEQQRRQVVAMRVQTENSELSLERLGERLERLEQRVAALEKPAALLETPQEPAILGSKPSKPGDTERRVGRVIPVLGKAVLAIAGAYLLRALAESGSAPRLLLLIVAILYAGAWLVWAARIHRKNSAASATFGMTAALILAPLLWEGTARFQQLNAGFTSVVLVGYLGLSLVLAWKESLEVIPWIAAVAAVATSLTLLVATHELKALTIGLLGMALLAEAAGWSGRWPGVRAITALGADFAVAVIGFIMTASPGLPEGYPAMRSSEITAIGMALILLYAGSLAVRGFVLGKNWTFGEVAQTAIAFGLGTWVSLRGTQQRAALPMGILFAVAGLFSYWGGPRRFVGETGKRNRVVTLNFGAALLLAGVVLAGAAGLQAVLLGVAAVAAVLLFARTGYLSLAIQASLFLLASSFVCGLFGYTAGALIGAVPARPGWSFWPVLAASIAVDILGARTPSEGKAGRLLWLTPAAIVGFATAALAITGMSALSGGELSVSRLSMVRTMVTCVMALALGYVGARWDRVELRWVAYGAVSLGALKLVLEDLRFGNAGTLMVSLLFYGLILILLPRVTRFGRVEA